MTRTIAVVSNETLKLREYLSLQSSGAFLEYRSIEEESGVKMNSKGKQLLRNALHFLRLEYSCVAGKGIELAGVETAVGIMTHGFVRVSNSIKKAAKTQKNIQEKFYDDLPDQDKKKVLLAGSIFAMMHVMSKDSAAKLSRRIVSNAESYKIPLPDM